MHAGASGSDVDRVFVAGGSGKTGRRVLRQFARSDVVVRTLTRSPEKRDPLAEAGADEVLVGDLREDAERAVADVDAVFSCVGSTPLQVHLADEHVVGDGNVAVIQAAVAADVDALVMLSSLGVDGDRGSWMARLFRSIIGPVVDAKTRAEQTLRESGLRYTIFRPGVLVSHGPGVGRVAEAGTGLRGAVTRGEVARLMAAAPFTSEAANRTFEVAANPLERGRGLDIHWQAP